MDQQLPPTGILLMWAGRPRRTRLGASPQALPQLHPTVRPAKTAAKGWPWGEVRHTD